MDSDEYQLGPLPPCEITFFCESPDVCPRETVNIYEFKRLYQLPGRYTTICEKNCTEGLERPP